MTWQDISQLYRDGLDIESHSTSHKVIDKLSPAALDYEVGQLKQCLHDHLGIYPIVFSSPHGRGSKNATVIDAIAKYYDPIAGISYMSHKIVFVFSIFMSASSSFITSQLQ